MSGRRARARWIAVLCALAATPVLVAGVRAGIRFVRENRAIEALRSGDEEVRKAALRELADLRSVRGVPAILSTMPSDEKTARALFHIDIDENGHLITAKVPTEPLNAGYWEGMCGQAIRLTGMAAVPVLRSKLVSPDSTERFWSLFFLLRVLDAVPDPPYPEVLSLLGDSDLDVSVFACTAVGLSAARNHRTLERLVGDLVRSDASEHMRILVSEAIRTAASPWDQPFHALARDASLDAEHPSAEMIAARRSAAVALLEAARGPSEGLGHAAQRALYPIILKWFSGDQDLKAAVDAAILEDLSRDAVSRRSKALHWIEDLYGDPAERSMPPAILEGLGKTLEDASEEIRGRASPSKPVGGHPRAPPGRRRG